MARRAPTPISLWRGADMRPSLKSSNHVGLNPHDSEKAPDKRGPSRCQALTGEREIFGQAWMGPGRARRLVVERGQLEQVRVVG